MVAGRQLWSEWAIPVARRLAAAAGGALLVWLMVRAGPAVLLAQARTLGPLLPVVVLVTGVRYVLQAAAWRLAMPARARVSWLDAAAATVAAEAVGYLSVAGGVAREGVRPLVARGAAPTSVLVAAGLVERVVYAATAGAVSLLALGVVLRSRVLEATLVASMVAGGVALASWSRRRQVRRATLGRRRPAAALRAPGLALAAMAALSTAQVVLLLLEAYLVLDRLGARPTVSTVLVFEGATKMVNLAASFVPAGLGVAEGAAAATGAWVGVGAGFGMGLALTRRLRSVLWAIVGLAVLVRFPRGRPAASRGTATGVPQAEAARGHLRRLVSWTAEETEA